MSRGLARRNRQHAVAAYPGTVYLAVNLLDANSLIGSWGLAGLIFIIFAETGLLIGFFLPGDTLLFLAGASTVADAKYHISLAGLLLGAAVASVLGAQAGWLIGAKAGPVLFDRPRSRLFDPHNVARARRLLERFHYSFAIVLSRFIPIVRTFINPVCGVAQISGRAFFVWNLIGGILWTQLIVLLGRALGPSVHIDRYILPIVGGIAVLSVAGVLLEARRGGQRRKLADAAAAEGVATEDAAAEAAATHAAREAGSPGAD
jgi:membrane-associated protein